MRRSFFAFLLVAFLIRTHVIVVILPEDVTDGGVAHRTWVVETRQLVEFTIECGEGTRPTVREVVLHEMSSRHNAIWNGRFAVGAS